MFGDRIIGITECDSLTHASRRPLHWCVCACVCRALLALLNRQGETQAGQAPSLLPKKPGPLLHKKHPSVNQL